MAAKVPHTRTAEATCSTWLSCWYDGIYTRLFVLLWGCCDTRATIDKHGRWDGVVGLQDVAFRGVCIVCIVVDSV